MNILVTHSLGLLVFSAECLFDVLKLLTELYETLLQIIHRVGGFTHVLLRSLTVPVLRPVMNGATYRLRRDTQHVWVDRGNIHHV